DDDQDDDDQDEEEETKDGESFDPIAKTPENLDDEGNDDANLGLNVGSEEGHDAADDEDKLYRDVNINLEGRDFAGAVSSIPGIVQIYMDQRMNEAVKVKVQVSKILPKIEKAVNEQLEAEVLTRSSNSSKTSYAVVADLSEMELKKILIERMESNKDTVMLKRRCDDADKDEEPFFGSDRGSKRRRERKEPESPSAPKERVTKTTGKSTQGSKSQQKTASESTPAEEPMQTTQDLEEPTSRTKASDYRHIKWIEDLVPRIMWSQEPVSYEKHALWGISHWGRKRQQFYGFAINREFARDVYSKRRIIVVTELLIVEWKANKSDGQRTLCFQRLSKNVHKKHRHPTTYERSSTSDGTLNDVRTALDDRLKGIRMKYLSQAIWRKSDKERAAAMIQAIHK
nr:hypothetical protein [Tanacetum cinerariifolium]